MKINVAIPVYDGKVPVETIRCLLNEQLTGLLGGDVLQFRFLPNCSHPAMGRNQLTQDFMDSDFDRLVFLDSDITFEVGALIKLAHQPVDFVGGVYRFKTEAEAYPLGWLDNKELRADENGLLEVAHLPGGFLSISRKVFELLKAENPDRHYEHLGHKAHCYFEMKFDGGDLYGEDTHFCKEWRKLGGKVFLDPELKLTHWDFNKPYVGHIGNWLKRRNGLTA